MYQNFNNYGYPYGQPKPIKCFPVSSFDEVKSAMIGFDGSINVFTDLANGVIYTKGINMDGTAFINTYRLTQNPANVCTLEDRVIQLENAIQELKGGLANEIYTGSDQNYTESSDGVDAELTGEPKPARSSSANRRK